MNPSTQLKCYYAHPVSEYGTDVEKNDVAELNRAGFEVVNPNTFEHADGYEKGGMGYFRDLVATCDVLAFRAFPNASGDPGSIPAGVFAEIKIARFHKKPVFELTTLDDRFFERSLSVNQTRDALNWLGRGKGFFKL